MAKISTTKTPSTPGGGTRGAGASVTHLGDLTPDPANARRHNPRNVGMLVEALNEVGAARSIVIDEDGVVLAGNATIEAAAEAGITRVVTVDADGETLVAVRRSGLTAQQKTRLALFDNRVAELAEWEPGVLERLRAEGATEGLFSDVELDALFADAEATEIAPGDGGDEFDTTPADGPTRCQPGDLWELGEHRLLCGDSTSAEDVARLLAGETPRLMVTDPPYGVDYDPSWRNEAAAKGHIAFAARREGKVENDGRVSWLEAYSLFPGDVIYCWHAGRHASTVAADLIACGFEIRNQVIWAKPRFAISRGHYHWQHEPCWYAVRKGATSKWIGDRSQTTLWEISQSTDGHKTDHGTQKPLECMARPIRNHGGDVYDPFCGSGTTLIAAERLNRRCFALEISPKYCDVILRRFTAESGIEPVLVEGGS